MDYGHTVTNDVG